MSEDFPLNTDLQRAQFRKTLTFYRSRYVVGTRDQSHQSFDETIHDLLNELSGENQCYMDLQQVVITPIEYREYPENDLRRTQYVVTILAKVARGYPQYGPQPFKSSMESM